jgi:hypothetical protein
MRLIDLPTLRKANLRSGPTRMTARQINQALWITAACLCGIAALVLVLGVLLPVNAKPPADEVSKSAGKHSTPGEQASLPSLESFESIWPKPLRRPMVDAPVAPPAPTGPGIAVAGAVPMTLVGTIGNSLAMLQTPDGTIALKGVGEQLAGADVVAVRPGEVDLRYGGRDLTLTKPKDASQAGMIVSPNNQ